MSEIKCPIFIETPLIYSNKLSKLVGGDIYLKLENDQPSGAFKLRGNGYHSQKEVERGCKRLITASGGNTGMAVTRAGQVLGVPVTVFIPKSTPQMVIDVLREQGAEVTVHGDNFGMANDRALEEAKKPGCSYIHPYIHPETWQGHSTMVDEIAKQLGQGVRPGCFIVSVGGGGLAKGVLTGIERHGWADVPVIGVETEGADCLRKALEAGKPVELAEITSIAVTLGAKMILTELFDELPKFNFIPHVVTDKQAVQSCVRFADDHRILVEPSCGAALSVIYFDLLKELIPKGIKGPIVVIVCGGSGVSLTLLQKWAQQFNLDFPYKGH
ncbi:serine dehydratase-like [Neocloeon triangulifer]|uniref:serine dehydratase-like n=1 Tax=Neocloeon triangulifer TaxID=2078957 RepID=UPI00286F81BF|nr:serine dehydratase-like [Neocloeon triangulifer]